MSYSIKINFNKTELVLLKIYQKIGLNVKNVEIQCYLYRPAIYDSLTFISLNYVKYNLSAYLVELCYPLL